MKNGLTLVFLSVLIASCTSTATKYEQLPSNNSNTRVKSLIMHFTAIDYEKSVRALVDKDGLSSHYLVPESNDPSYPYDELKILQLVDEKERAWHAGRSYWQGRTGLNDTSIGIEIVNVPKCEQQQDSLLKAEHGTERLCVFPDFDPKQLALVIELSKGILARNPDIEPTAVIGHSDIAPSRKNDPGPRFPWQQLYEEGIGAWYDQDTLASYWQRFSETPVTVGLLQAAFHAYGYGIAQTGVMDQQTIDVISAFQMHFLPWQVNGKNDESTSAAIFALIDKYFPDKLDALMFRYENENAQPIAPVIVTNGQIDRWFTPSNNATSFFAYNNTGEITVSATEPTRADIYINGAKLNLSDPFTQIPATYSIGKRTRNGLNSISMNNFSTTDASVLLKVSYPTIFSNSTKANSKVFAAADSVVSGFLDSSKKKGQLVVIQRGKRLMDRIYGSGQVSGSTPQFNLHGSSHTMSSTLAIMHLVAQEKIDIDKPVFAYLPEYRGQGRDLITIRDLLMHTSGYQPFVTDYLGFDGPELDKMLEDDAFVTDLLLSKLPAAKSVTSSPSEINHLLLAHIAERVSGLTLEDYVQAHVYQPLELSTSFVHEGADKHTSDDKNLSQSGDQHNANNTLLQALTTSASDMATIAQLLLNQGGYGFTQLFDQHTFLRFIRPDSQNNEQVLGWQSNALKFVSAAPALAPFGAKASTSAFGYVADNYVIFVDPKMELCIVFVSDLHDVNQHASALIDAIYEDILTVR